MIIYPAIDLMARAAVRLRQGDPRWRTAVADDPVAVARRWVDEGATWLHVVDLDGALAGAPRHLDLVGQICRAVPVPVQAGGGLRTMADLRALFDAGAARAILGTAALAGPLLREATSTFGDRIAVALDARDGRLAVEGWQRDLPLPVAEAARALAEAGVARLIYTDTRRDGTLAGPDLEGLRALVAAAPVPVILSGGIATVEDLRAAARAGAEGAIVGLALYAGRIRLADAMAAGRPGDPGRPTTAERLPG
ncbi:MAG: 1-(5-phosphoribosyl)-5-[(5-phosphoribosylamino)methylideneamino]imidazole-4-carboxamide isomerase [Armatimonadota bacterium]|nr:1-(5-phosphoribosyl)-5-[(5-phosphoribosylamino)methylideneamino]imidazole-4-carboxamide isomerase [Armatimonadota bacterium]MDR7550867.1 1-(5-phosphoribosyl)-5-[(5-phosphoribosylamino)methylideneamino]imidazole-4-carboxamide isomerase [Armatimonadota bacterium]